MRKGSFFHYLWQAVRYAFAHDALTMAKAASYSAVVSMFPALLVLVFLLRQSPETAGLQHTLSTIVASLLPPNAVPVILDYVSQEQHKVHSDMMLTSTTMLSFIAALSVVATLMEGFRRAYSIRREDVNLLYERMKAAVLVPLSLVPMTLASAVIVYGHQIQGWVSHYAGHQTRVYIVLGWRMLRWVIALSCSVVVLMMIYQYGVPVRHKWRSLLPGAALATATWFGATLLFGWYVGHFAHYAQVYGQLGAGIALLFWLYMVAYSVLVGAEFNARRANGNGNTIVRYR